MFPQPVTFKAQGFKSRGEPRGFRSIHRPKCFGLACSGRLEQLKKHKEQHTLSTHALLTKRTVLFFTCQDTYAVHQGFPLKLCGAREERNIFNPCEEYYSWRASVNNFPGMHSLRMLVHAQRGNVVMQDTIIALTLLCFGLLVRPCGRQKFMKSHE